MKNKYIVNGKVTTIFIKQRSENVVATVIDTEDLSRLIKNKYSLCVRWDEKRKTYRVKVKTSIDGIVKLVYLYRFLVNAPSDKMVDHKNHDTLDNRKSNLRLVNNQQNLQNRAGADCDSKSGYRNVWWNTQQNKWSVSFSSKRKHYYCGSYESIAEAIAVANKKRKEILPGAM